MILQNAIQINGEILQSFSRHDYKEKIVKGKNKKKYLFMVDGGYDYFHGACPNIKESTMKRYGLDYKNLRLTIHEEINEIMDKFIAYDNVFLKDSTIIGLENKIDDLKKFNNDRVYFIIKLFEYKLLLLNTDEKLSQLMFLKHTL